MEHECKLINVDLLSQPVVNRFRKLPSKHFKGLDLASLLFLVRHHLCLSQRGLGDVLNVTPMAVSNYERGMRKPWPLTRAKLIELCDYLEIECIDWNKK